MRSAECTSSFTMLRYRHKRICTCRFAWRLVIFWGRKWTQQKLTIRKTAPSRTVFIRTSMSIGTASRSTQNRQYLCTTYICLFYSLLDSLPPTKKEVNAFARICLSVCLSVSKITQKWCIDLDEMWRVDRCRDMDELNNFWARSGL